MSTTWTTKKVEAVLREAIKLGYVQVGYDSEGVPRYWLTPQGEKHLDAVIAGEEED